MVGVFKRSLSFPNKALKHTKSKPPPISHQIRSISLPCRSHPLISRLKEGINELKSWSSSKPNNRNSAWLCDGLCLLKDVHDSLDDILQLPQTQECLGRRPELVEKLLEDFLRFVDVYGIFQTSFLALKEAFLATEIAVRKRDESKIEVHVKSCKKIGREISQLAQTVQRMGRYLPFGVKDSVQPVNVIAGGDNIELVGVIRDVLEVAVSVSIALFSGVSLSFLSRKFSWTGLVVRIVPKKGVNKRVKIEEGIQEFQQVGMENLWGLKKMGDEEVKMALKRMHELEGCVGDIESGSERVFRGLINARASLLNSMAL